MYFARLAHSRSISRIAAMAMLAACGALAACGYKGPLYMPGSPQDHPRRVPPPALEPGKTAAPKPAAQPNVSDTARPVPNLFQQ